MVGVIVNAVLASPVAIQPAGEAIYGLADDMARVLEGVAADLREGWSGEDAYERLLEARELDGEIAEAREAVGRAEDSLRLNPGAGSSATPPTSCRTPSRPWSTRRSWSGACAGRWSAWTPTPEVAALTWGCGPPSAAC